MALNNLQGSICHKTKPNQTVKVWCTLFVSSWKCNILCSSLRKRVTFFICPFAKVWRSFFVYSEKGDVLYLSIRKSVTFFVRLFVKGWRSLLSVHTSVTFFVCISLKVWRSLFVHSWKCKFLCSTILKSDIFWRLIPENVTFFVHRFIKCDILCLPIRKSDKFFVRIHKNVTFSVCIRNSCHRNEVKFVLPG